MLFTLQYDGKKEEIEANTFERAATAYGQVIDALGLPPLLLDDPVEHAAFSLRMAGFTSYWASGARRVRIDYNGDGVYGEWER